MTKASIAERIVGVFMTVLGFALGAWIIHMALQGRTPAEAFKTKEEAFVFGLVGCVFCIGSLMILAWTLLQNTSSGQLMTRICIVSVTVALGGLLLATGILTPQNIHARVGINKTTIHLPQQIGSPLGRVIFVAVGSLLILFAPKIYRLLKRAQELQNQRNDSQSGDREED
jgi:hypothetical protein